MEGDDKMVAANLIKDGIVLIASGWLGVREHASENFSNCDVLPFLIALMGAVELTIGGVMLIFEIK